MSNMQLNYLHTLFLFIYIYIGEKVCVCSHFQCFVNINVPTMKCTGGNVNVATRKTAAMEGFEKGEVVLMVLFYLLL